MLQITDHHNGIFSIEAHYLKPGVTTLHLVVSDGRAAIIDTATAASLPFVLDGLESLGLTPAAVDYVILTHIHLDHVGGAGAMLEAFPNARLVVHPRGARHMIEPSKLMAGVEAVYGQQRAREMYGVLQPIAADRIIEAADGTVLRLGQRELLCLDSPGHARHHIAIVDRQSSGIFSGDTFGISYRECDVDGRAFVFPSTTPSQFEPEAMRASIERMLAFQPDAIYPTHYGRLAPPAELARDVLRRLDDCVRIARAHAGDEAPTRREMDAYLLSEVRAHGCRLPDAEVLDLWAMDLELNAQGIALWARG